MHHHHSHVFTRQHSFQKTSPISNFRKARALISAMLFNLCIGSYYVYGNLNGYMVYYFKDKGFKINTTNGLVVQPVWIIIQSLVSLISLRIADRIGFTNTNWIAFILYSSTYFICSYITNFYVFIVVYSIMCGVSCGLGYMIGLYITWTYFPKARSVVSGLIFFAAGGSASILSIMSTLIINPSNLDQSDPKVFERFPLLLRWLGVYFLALTVIAGIIQPHPAIQEHNRKKKEFKHEEEHGHHLQTRTRKLSIEVDLAKQKMDQHKENIGDSIKSSRKPSLDKRSETVHNSSFHSSVKSQSITSMSSVSSGMYPTIRRGLLSFPMLFLCVMAFSSSMQGYFFNGAWKYIAEQQIDGITDQMLASLLTICGVFNSISRVTMGVLNFYVPYRWLYTIVIVAQIFIGITIFMFAKSYVTFSIISGWHSFVKEHISVYFQQ